MCAVGRAAAGSGGPTTSPCDLPVQLAACASGVELIGKGFAADVAIAAGLDVSAVVPVLTDGWFSARGSRA